MLIHLGVAAFLEFLFLLFTYCMHILLTGGTGFIGRFLVPHLRAQGHTLTLLTRRVQPDVDGIHYVRWDARSVNNPGDWAQEVNKADAIINLAGEGIFDGRWTPAVKERLLASRIEATRALVEAVAVTTQTSRKPHVFISASAVGYYGDRADALTDESAPAGSDFLAKVCVEWERTAQAARALGVRVVHPRIGIVLHPSGGALARMMIPFQLWAGMPLGSGRQWFPWIHIHDLVRGIAEPLTNEALQGAYNLAAPNVVTMHDFCAALGKAMHRPSWPFAVPEFALELALGEAASSLTGGQRIIPKALVEAGFTFDFPDVYPALVNLFTS
jgi:uncharacterized protein (TIGR01777 family)